MGSADGSDDRHFARRRARMGSNYHTERLDMRLNHHRTVILALALVAAGTATRPAQAQRTLHPSFYGSAEVDTRHSQFYLLGMYVGMGGLGWSPYFNVNGYALHYRPNHLLTNT